MENTYQILGYVIIVLTIGLMIILMLKTEILKDISECQVNKPYSLSRVQLALWTVIIFCSFVYLLSLKDFGVQDVKLTNGALILLGISAGVTILGRTIDGTDQKNLAARAISHRHQDDCSKGFLWDLLWDGTGVSVHRFQNVIFTAVLMICFVVYVIRHESIPELPDTLLVLSGISAAGYLGVKVNENR